MAGARDRNPQGSKGPTRKLPSLGHITLEEMAAGYTEQALELIEGGVDVLQLETCQDILQAKAGLVGIFDALKKSGKNVPVQVQVTLRESGVMLLGTEIGRGAHDAGDVRRWWRERPGPLQSIPGVAHGKLHAHRYARIQRSQKRVGKMEHATTHID